MLKRLYLKNLLSFDELELNFENGLIVFTGPSGAGKSILMQSILANFGLGFLEAKLCEIELKKPKELRAEDFELDDTLVVKALKKERARFYLNSQNISKKRLKELFAPYIYYLSVQDERGFESKDLIELIDNFISKDNLDYQNLLNEYKSRFEIYKKKLQELKKIKEDEKRVVELIEFAKFEIEKIASINPAVGEYEELLNIKHKLSKIDKIQEAIQRASAIFELEDEVSEVFTLLEKDGSYFSEAMNQLKVDFEEIEEFTAELSDIDIEEVLSRLEKLSWLINRYGSIEEAIEYKKKKESELERLERISYDKRELEEFIEFERDRLLKVAKDISKKRKNYSKELAKDLSKTLSTLNLPDAKFIFRVINLDENGIDEVDLELEGSSISTLSGGEFNRLRLALMAIDTKMIKSKKGVIFLDEMDANVSGDESIAIANMVEKLSKNFQIFAISHQPHLSAKATQHILVSKEKGVSKAKILDKSDRVQEVARIISGQKAKKEAIAFAKKLFQKESV